MTITNQKLALVFLLLAMIITPDTFVSAAQSRHAPTLGVIQDDSEYDGCGCSLFRNRRDAREHRPIFLSDFSGEARINLDGRDVRVRLIGASPERRRAERKGDRSWEVYGKDSFRMRIDYVVNGVCPSNDEACEVTSYEVVITLIHNGRTTTMPAFGLCGC